MYIESNKWMCKDCDDKVSGLKKHGKIKNYGVPSDSDTVKFLLTELSSFSNRVAQLTDKHDEKKVGLQTDTTRQNDVSSITKAMERGSLESLVCQPSALDLTTVHNDIQITGSQLSTAGIEINEDQMKGLLSDSQQVSTLAVDEHCKIEIPIARDVEVETNSITHGVNIGRNTAEVGKRPSVDRLTYFLVSRLASCETTDTIEQRVRRKLGNVDMVCQELRKRLGQKSFKLNLPVAFHDKIRNDDLWPRGAKLKVFKFPRNYPAINIRDYPSCVTPYNEQVRFYPYLHV